MSKEAIALLESIKVVPAKDDSEGNTCCKMKVSDYQKIFQALAILKQPKAQPSSEFTEKLRKFVQMYENEVPRRAEINLLEKACDILETSKANIANAEKGNENG